MSIVSTYNENAPIVLIGLMGAGKTTIGRRLARALNLDFVDSDHEIEIAADMSVAELFESYGETEFRSLERRVISRLMDGTQKVLATGGGAFINAQTRKLILDGALTIWLEADLETLVERTSRRDSRPLLNEGNPQDILQKLIEERYPIYKLAPIHVVSSDGPHEDVVKTAVKQIKDFREKVNAPI